MNLKNNRSNKPSAFTLWEIIVVVAIIAILAAFFAPKLLANDIIVSGRSSELKAHAGVVTNGTGLTVALTNGTYTSTTSSLIPVDPDADLTLFIAQVASATGTSNNTYGFNLEGLSGTAKFSGSSSNFWTTTLPISLTLSNNGTTPVTGIFQISHTNFANCDWLRWDSFSTTQTNTVTPTIRYKWRGVN